MICPPCAAAADAITEALAAGDLDQPTGHDPSVCVDVDCTCQHKPIERGEAR
ncbi:hypothetical protein [Actinomadura nitritigenes]|uniref:hypothetical protein n=1 Tax=Actinomadura nitritigenes TaxID=134602 RepID=UPI003D8F38CC